MLGPDEVCREIKQVDIGPTLSVMHLMEFEDSGGVCAQVTKKGSEAPDELKALISGLELGGKAARLFLRRLGPGVCIAPHVDKHTEGWASDGWRRFQLPLVSHPEIVMRWPDDEVEVHLKPGFLYEVRVDRTHEVINKTAFERIHMQIDQVGATI